MLVPLDHLLALQLPPRLLLALLQLDRSERATATLTRAERSARTTGTTETETTGLTLATIGMTAEETTTTIPVLTTIETMDPVTGTVAVEATRATTTVEATRVTEEVITAETLIVGDEVVTVATTKEDIAEESIEVDIRVFLEVGEEDIRRVELPEGMLLIEVVEDDRHPACLFLLKEAVGPSWRCASISNHRLYFMKELYKGTKRIE